MAPLNPHHEGDQPFTVRQARRWLSFIFIALGVLLFFQSKDDDRVAAQLAKERARADLIICQESAQNRDAIRDSLKRGFVNLGYVWDEKQQEAIQKSAPTLKYWKDHPDEIPTQLERLRQELDGFPKIDCANLERQVKEDLE